jgi:hypothetical protein
MRYVEKNLIALLAIETLVGGVSNRSKALLSEFAKLLK